MKNPKLFLDFDNVIINATQKFCSCYNTIYQHHPNFVPAQWKLVDKWNFKDQCTLVTNVEEIFAMRMFFTDLPFINDNTYEVLKEVNEKYHIILVSIGSYGNISNKSLWVAEYLPFIKDSIFLVNNGCIMNKELIDMSIKDNEYHPVFIDDVVSNLESSNAKYKVAYGDLHEWNMVWDGDRCMNWTEVAKMLL